MNSFFANKGLGFWFTVAAVILNLIAVILYGVSRENVTGVITALLVSAIIVGVIVAFKHFRFTEFLPFVLSAIPLAMAVFILLDNISQIWFKNNVVGLSATIIPAIVFMALATVSSAAALVCSHEQE